MKISLNWLSNYIDISEFYQNTNALADVLTQAGLEVDGVENMAENLKNVVVGQVSSLERHPDADKLTLCQIDVGGDKLSQIICGAQNHKQGDKVVVALPGAVLPGEFKIKKSKIRGVESHGMLCSDTELGLSGESDGIRILPETASIGQSFAEYSGLDDIVFNLGVTANRADCLSHLGLARELSCLLDKPLKVIESQSVRAEFNTSDLISVDLQDSTKCSRYTACVVKNIKVGQSPAWLQSYLQNVDINSVNNVVDITNFVMLEYGQPMHAFDLKELADQKIVIKSIEQKMPFTSLDGSQYELNQNELAICDSQRIVALAGVVGGQNSGISEGTTDIVLEVAHFHPSAVRKTARAHGIETDSSYRFSRGTDPTATVQVIERAAHLIQKICGGEVACQVIDKNPKPFQPAMISINYKYVEERLGYSVDSKEFNNWMSRLGCNIIDENMESVQLQTPSWRCDLEIKEDLVEEFARLNGYDKIPESLPSLNYEPLIHDPTYLQKKYTYNFFAKQGLYQSVNYNFISSEFSQQILGDISQFKESGLTACTEPVLVQNPLSEEYNLMRPSLVPSLFKNLITNYRGGVMHSSLFEVGTVFSQQELKYIEDNHLGLVSWGASQNLWAESEAPQVLNLKAIIENFLTSLKAKSWAWKKWDSQVSFMHPGRSAILFYQGKNVGYITELHPKLKQKFKFRDDVAFAEFNLDRLMQGFPKKPKLSLVSKFPVVERDFSFVIDKSVASDDLVAFIKKTEKKLILSVELVKLFEGNKLPEGKRSLTFKVLFQDKEKTMTEDVIKALHADILGKVQAKYS